MTAYRAPATAQAIFRAFYLKEVTTYRVPATAQAIFRAFCLKEVTTYRRIVRIGLTVQIGLTVRIGLTVQIGQIVRIGQTALTALTVQSGRRTSLAVTLRAIIVRRQGRDHLRTGLDHRLDGLILRGRTRLAGIRGDDHRGGLGVYHHLHFHSQCHFPSSCRHFTRAATQRSSTPRTRT